MKRTKLIDKEILLQLTEEGLTVVEIAERLNISKAKAYTNIDRHNIRHNRQKRKIIEKNEYNTKGKESDVWFKNYREERDKLY
jgi:predicted transcriptional regulator